MSKQGGKIKKEKREKPSEKPWIIHLSSGDVVVGPGATPSIPPATDDPDAFWKKAQELAPLDIFGFEDKVDESSSR